MTSTCICRGGEFLFDFNISTGYPHDAPKVKCLTRVRLLLSSCRIVTIRQSACIVHCARLSAAKDRRTCHGDTITAERTLQQVYHPNIDTEGNICLNILREDWKPVLSINSVVYGLNFLFLVRPCEASCLCSTRQGRCRL